MSSLRSSFKNSKEFKSGSSLTLTNSCYGTSFSASPLQNTLSIPTFQSSPTQPSFLNKSNSHNISLPFGEVMDEFHKETTTKINLRPRSDSVANTLNTNIDIENRQIWNDHPLVLVNHDDSFNPPNSKKKNKNLYQKYSLSLPNKLEEEYLAEHYKNQILLLRLTNLIGIIAVTYGFTKRAIFMLIAIRILCFNLFSLSIVLSFLKNKSFYRKLFHPLFIFSFTAYFITILLEYKTSTTTFILFLYSVIFSCLYALGCLLFVWMVICNLMNAVCFIIFIFLQSNLDTMNSISYILYILTIFVMGLSHLYVLEKSRKESFVNEKRLGKRAESLREEKEKSEQLLANILPEFVIKMMNREWIENRSSQPISKDFPDCSILYCDIVEFTSLASKIDPESLVKLLNEVFTEFDRVVEENGCEKIKTDGDAYVCAAGLTIHLEQHYKAILNTAIEILNLKVLKTNCLGVQIKIRVGVATGSVIGGVIGVQKFQFDVWGDAIAMAHSLEQTGSPGKIQISDTGLDRLNLDDYVMFENTDKPLGISSYFIVDKKRKDETPSNPIENIPKKEENSVEPNQCSNPTIENSQNYESSPNTFITENNDIIKNNSVILDGCDQKLKKDTQSSDVQNNSGSSDSCSSSFNNVDNNSISNRIQQLEPVELKPTPEESNETKPKPKVQFKDLSETEVSELSNTMTTQSDQSLTSSSKDEISIDMKPLNKKRKIVNYICDRMKTLQTKISKRGSSFGGSHTHSPRTNRVHLQLSDMDKEFQEFSDMNNYIVQFKKMFVEREFHKYVIRNTIIETKFFLAIGAVLHLVFFIDDLVMKSDSMYSSNYIYLGMGIVFAIYFLLSFTQLFRKPLIYQLAFSLLLLLFGVSTLLELMRYGNPLARSSLTRICTILFYVNVFHSLNFVCIAFINLFIFVLLFLFASFVSESFLEHMFAIDYIGISIVLVIQLFSSYMMKKAMRKAWVIKSKVKFKGMVLNKEREKSAKLLENILPNSISEKLMSEGKGNGMLIAHSYPQVAIMFINIAGFEKLPESQEASAMINYMNTIFSTFDGLLARYNDLEKIKTIGTAYMVVGGLKHTQPKNYLFNMADMALTAKTLVKNFSKEQLNVQIGISVGPCVAGCIGIQRAKFDIWGDTANISSRMQTSAPAGKVQVTKEVARILRKGFFLEERGTIKVKGKGEMNTFFLNGKKTSNAELDSSGSYNQLLNGYEWPSIDIQKLQLLQFPGSYNIKEDEILK